MATNGTVQTVIGINFGNTYSSIAVLSNERTAECIANENGERQIASAVSFNGSEVYIGNQALPQLVKNARNTITGFRNLLGKKFDDVAGLANSSSSAPIIKHPDSDLPAYSVEILVPVEPLPKRSAKATPAASAQPTPAPSPPPEPQRVTKTLSVPEVTTLFLKSLLQSASDYLGRPIDGVVLPVPTWFTKDARDALVAAAGEAGVTVLQLIDEPAAAAVVLPTLPGPEDRTVLVLDVGASRLELALLALRAGLAHVIATSSTAGNGGNAIDDRIVSYFAREFTKKTKTPLSLPAENEEDARAERKLRLAVEGTKRALSASSGAAACSVESLKAGLDLSASVNRLRFDVEVTPVYTAIADAVTALLAQAGIAAVQVDEVLFVGGSARLPGLVSKLELVFPDTTTLSHGAIDSTEVLALGAALQAQTIAANAIEVDGVETKTTIRPLGVVFPGAAQTEELSEADGNWLAVIPAHTPVPARRTVVLELASGTTRFGFEIWEARDEVVVPPPVERPEKAEGDEDDEDEDEDEPPAPKLVTRKDTLLGALALDVSGKKSKISIEFLLPADGALSVAAWEEGAERQTISFPAP